jgi:hypothetical protein
VGQYRAIAASVARIFGNDRQGYRRVKTALERRKISIVMAAPTILARIKFRPGLLSSVTGAKEIGVSAGDFFANSMVTPAVRVASRQDGSAHKMSKSG